MKLYIKYMVNMQCRQIVSEELKKLGLHFVIADLGAVDVMENITDEQHENLRIALLKSGLELIERRKVVLIEKIKDLITMLVRDLDKLSETNFADYLSEKLNYEYNYLAELFSEGRGITIENFIIYQKTERVKELIAYNELSITEIARKLKYGTVKQLSGSFKNSTGLSLSHFKKINSKKQLLVKDIRDYGQMTVKEYSVIKPA